MGKKIMLVLLRTLGDVVLLNTLIETVKNYYGGDVTVFVNPEWKEIIENNPHVHEIRAEKDWAKNFYEVQKEMLKGDWDEVLVPQQLSPTDNAWHQYPETREQHLFDFYVDRCRIPKGHEAIVREVKMYPGMQKDMSPLIAEWAGKDQKMIVIHCTSGNHFKDMTRAQWKYLMEPLMEDGFSFAQVGLESDMLVCDEEMGKKGNVIDLRGKLTINEIWAFIAAYAHSFMGLDSGLSYVAASTKKPTYVWYGCTIPLTSGPWGENVQTYVSEECGVAKERNHIRCHNKCQAKPNCIQLFKSEEALRVFRERQKVTA